MSSAAKRQQAPVQPTPDVPSPVEALKKYVSIWVKGKLDLIDEIFDKKIVRHHPASIRPPEVSGRDAYKAFVTEFRNLHPDLKFKVLNAVADGNFVAFRYAASARNTANNERFTFGGMAMSRFSRGKIVEEWVTWDTYDLMSQVGLVPPREQ
jgi:predicted SnoaL-like aldol condensation-catalyzing enzyme